MVLERSGHDLGGRRRPFVDQDDDRDPRPGVSPGGIEDLLGGRVASPGENDLLSLAEEDVGEADRLVEKPAGVSPEVQDQPLHPLLLQLAPRLQHLWDGRLGEVLQADVGRLVVQEEGESDGVGRDLGARHGHLEGLAEAGPDDRDPDLRPLGALQPFDDGIHGQVVDRLALDPVDDVAGPDPEAVGGRPLDRGDDGDLAVPLGDDDPEAEEGAPLLLLHRPVLLGLEEVRVRVEGAQHPVDGRVDELVRGEVVGVPGLRGGQEVGVFLEGRVRGVGKGEELRAEEAAEQGGPCECHDGEEEPPLHLAVQVHWIPYHGDLRRRK